MNKRNYTSAEKIEFYQRRIDALQIEIDVLKLRIEAHKKLMQKKQKSG